MPSSKKSPIARQRRVEILSELEDQGSVRVTELAGRFGVAEETIRRDLDKLSEEGRVARTHGGALSIRNQRFDLPSSIRRNTQAAEKRRMAYQALSHIEENDVIAVDASTTALELVCVLPDMPLTLITYGVDAARLLIDRPQIQVISTGGELDVQSVCFLGPIAEKTLREFAIHKAFVSCKGVDMERGFSEASLAHASMKRLLMQLAGQTYAMVDHSKFGVRSMAYSGKLGAIDVLITDDQTDTQFIDAFQELGVRTEISSPEIPTIAGKTG